MTWYDDLGSVMGDLKADTDILETIILNTKNEKAHRYIRESILLIDRALASLSDAQFEMTTSPEEYDE